MQESGTLDTGPYLKAAVICSDVIEGKDGVLSFIRIIDRLTITVAGSQLPSDMPPLPAQRLKFVLMLISGRARGTHDVTLRVERPDATTRDVWNGNVFLEGEDRGANVIIDAGIKFQQEGLYWFDVYLDGAPLTRMPFRLIYQRVGGAPA